MNGDHMVTLGERGYKNDILKKNRLIFLSSTNGVKSTKGYSRGHQICFNGHKTSKFIEICQIYAKFASCG